MPVFDNRAGRYPAHPSFFRDATAERPLLPDVAGPTTDDLLRELITEVKGLRSDLKLAEWRKGTAIHDGKPNAFNNGSYQAGYQTPAEVLAFMNEIAAKPAVSN